MAARPSSSPSLPRSEAHSYAPHSDLLSVLGRARGTDDLMGGEHMANLGIAVAVGQAITAVGLSKRNFTGGAPSGTTVGTISVAMSPASPPFFGSLSLSGTNA